MRQQLEQLQNQLLTVGKFEELFNSPNGTTFKKNYGSDSAAGSFVHFMMNGSQSHTQKAALAFDNFVFDGDDARAVYVAQATQMIRQIVSSNPHTQNSFAALDDPTSSKRAFGFFNLIIYAIFQANRPQQQPDFLGVAAELLLSLSASPTKQVHNPINDLVAQARQLIAHQKSKLEKSIAEIAPRAQAEAELELKNAATTQFRKKCTRYTGCATLATVGTAAIAFSALMQFSPQFLMLASLHLPSVALAAVAVTGLVMVASAAYIAYRTYNPATVVVAAPVANVGYSKLLTAALMTTGLGLAGFSALVQFSPSLMQFSPKFALLMGLHLSPGALIAIATVGALVLSVSLYRACKAYAQSSPDTAPVAEKPATAVQNSNGTNCMQHLSQYVCCFNLFKRTTPTNSTADPLVVTEGVAVVAAK